MILTCPSCGTQYVVKDGAIPPQGRQVRCAACKHSWHQEPGEAAAPEEHQPAPDAYAAETGAPVDESSPADEQESFAEASMIEPRSGPEAEERAYEEAVIEGSTEPDAPAETEPAAADAAERFEPSSAAASDYDAPPAPEAQPDDDFSPFAEREFVEPRRRSPLLRILLLLVAIAVLAAAFWFLAPAEWKTRLGLAEAGATPLTLVTTHMDMQKLESGNKLLTVAGRVINQTGKSHPVPPIYAQLKTRSGKVVYTWKIEPPAPSLAPGASAPFNSAEVDVPNGAEELTITLGAPKA
jgi:predicted Zn finger-like uncharacterized protein